MVGAAVSFAHHSEESNDDADLEDGTEETIRRKGYLTYCTHRDIIPVSSIVKSPCRKRVELPFHGLGDKSIAALMQGLKVNTCAVPHPPGQPSGVS